MTLKDGMKICLFGLLLPLSAYIVIVTAFHQAVTYKTTQHPKRYNPILWNGNKHLFFPISSNHVLDKTHGRLCGCGGASSSIKSLTKVHCNNKYKDAMSSPLKQQPISKQRTHVLPKTKKKATTIYNRIILLLMRIRSFLRHFWKRRTSWLRSIIERHTIYVLECDDDKIYVGSTTNRKQRIKTHFSDGGGSAWTRLHKPISIMKQYKRVPGEYSLGLEAQVTANLMWKLGVNNVRGAMFSETRDYTRRDLVALTGFLGHYNELDYQALYRALRDTLPPPPRKLPKPSSSRNKKGPRRYARGRPSKQSKS